MHKCRLCASRKSILFIIVAQTLLIIFYITTQDKPSKEPLQNHVVFVKTPRGHPRNKTSYIFNRQISLFDFKTTKEFFTDFNSSLCYNNGTDIKSMERRRYSNWKCECLPFWHGNDCGQPESVWRALLTSQKTRKKRIVQRKFERRLIYLFHVEETDLTLTEIRLGELWEVVDLFVLLELHGDYFKINLDRGKLKKYHQKIMYIKLNSLNKCFAHVKHLIVNLQDDDLILYSNSSFSIPNNTSLKFLKIYNNLPLLATFRLRWSVFGFFWKHPQRTILSDHLATVKIIRQFYADNLTLLSNATIDNKRLIIGDLNHFGGWFCEYCTEPQEIIKLLAIKQRALDNINVIDAAYIEELIENGIYIDGNTALIRARKFNENYFAPSFTQGNNVKFDFLLGNMYSKLDYED